MFPLESTFTLAATGEITHKFRRFTIEDELWIKRAFGSDTVVNDLVKALDVKKLETFQNIAKAWVYQLEDPTPFSPENVRRMDPETGEFVDLRRSAADKFLGSISSTGNEAKTVLDAYVVCFMNAQTVLEFRKAQLRQREMQEAVATGPEAVDDLKKNGKSSVSKPPQSKKKAATVQPNPTGR